MRHTMNDRSFSSPEKSLQFVKTRSIDGSQEEICVQDTNGCPRDRIDV